MNSSNNDFFPLNNIIKYKTATNDQDIYYYVNKLRDILFNICQTFKHMFIYTCLYTYIG